MVNPGQVISIEPKHDLKFKGGLSIPVATNIRLTNFSEKKLIFKIQTTVPKKYAVRPNIGRLDAFATIQITVCLGRWSHINDPNEQINHKFKAQAVYAPEDDVDLDLNQFWMNTRPEQIMESNSIRSVFEMPNE